MAQPILTADHLFGVDPKLADVTGLAATHSVVADDATIERTKAALQKHTHHVHVVHNGEEALGLIKASITKGASVVSTGSVSLQQIGYTDFAKTATEFNNLNSAILAETDPAKQHVLRRQSAIADFVITTPVAVSEDGEILIADLTGTRIAPIAAGGDVIFVVGANKITKNIDTAFKRLYEYTLPIESARVRIAYHMPQGASNASNVLVIRGPNPFAPKSRIHVIIVKQSLGF